MKKRFSIMSAIILCALAALVGGIINGVMPSASAQDSPTPPPVAAAAGGGMNWVNPDDTVCVQQPASTAKFQLHGNWYGAWNGANDRVQVTNKSMYVLNALDFTYDPGSFQTIFSGLGSRTRITAVKTCEVDFTVYETGVGPNGYPTYTYVVDSSRWVTQWADASGHRTATITSPFYGTPVVNPDGSWSSTTTMGTFVEARGRGTSVSDCRGYCYEGGGL